MTAGFPQLSVFRNELDEIMEQKKKQMPRTLKLNKEFKRAYYQGKSAACPYFICYRVKNRGQESRYGITTTKKVGNAVSRNRARRLIRAALRSVLDRLDSRYDYVFVARERILKAKSYQVAAAIKGCLKSFQNEKQNNTALKQNGKPDHP